MGEVTILFNKDMGTMITSNF